MGFGPDKAHDPFNPQSGAYIYATVFESRFRFMQPADQHDDIVIAANGQPHLGGLHGINAMIHVNRTTGEMRFLQDNHVAHVVHNKEIADRLGNLIIQGG